MQQIHAHRPVRQSLAECYLDYWCHLWGCRGYTYPQFLELEVPPHTVVVLSAVVNSFLQMWQKSYSLLDGFNDRNALNLILAAEREGGFCLSWPQLKSLQWWSNTDIVIWVATQGDTEMRQYCTYSPVMAPVVFTVWYHADVSWMINVSFDKLSLLLSFFLFIHVCLLCQEND